MTTVSPISPATTKKLSKNALIKPADACDLLGRLGDQLKSVDFADAQTVEAGVKAFCDSAGIELGQVIHALRVAVTGTPAGFGMFETLAILGKDVAVSRIDAALQHAATIRGDGNE